jgi:hypothetical protein
MIRGLKVALRFTVPGGVFGTLFEAPWNLGGDIK